MIVRKKIAVTGALGQLGLAIKEISKNYPQFEFNFLTREKLLISDEKAVKEYFKAHSPQYLVNCAAYTAVDKAEEEKQLAYAINSEAVNNLAFLCNECNTGFIHLSTDYVFDGAANRPYTEDAETHPLNVYGDSKRVGENNAVLADPRSIIIRTSWLYSSTGNNFLRTMLRLMQERSELNIVCDQLGSPTYARDLAEMILRIISSGKWVPGIFHFSNEGTISWYDFAVAIKELTNKDCQLHPISTSAYPTAARRPLYSVLDKKKIQEVYGIQLKNWKQSLRTCLEKLDLNGK